MDWDDLRFFLALARTKRLGTAAKLVGNDATTVSRRVQRLETQLQATLFEQTIRGYTLTSSGAALLARAEAMEGEAIGILESAGGDPDIITGPLRISVSEGFGSRILAPRLPLFTAAHPGVVVDLIASTGFLDPSRRETDVAVLLARPQRGPLITRKLTDYRLGLYASRQYLAKAPHLAAAADLTAHRLVGYVPDLIYAPELRYLEEAGIRLHPQVRSSSIIAQAELIAADAGCGILPCFIGDPDSRLVRLVPREISICRTFWLVIHRDVRRVARLDRFIRWLDQTVRALQPLMVGDAD